ncbi:major facilitator superfamily transporter [Colletotrichum graminicola]|uniref:Major facilitator superfamily transporter n=1 Tax=Colletotrichum graminicola (strain M1.001 / M2 / FGSC 10212) TaxID=645133 RepID=E3QYK5_COLGM|nr:major facilitator superfamily transporter [Colletotrichum graminicola M1.001]EFQ35943.1 major facilitator superfamily transporter [Colletotrichum graminicola M1.001]WDK16368.1 major facilitator superfamily transporter [Colletotrichum graminicola]
MSSPNSQSASDMEKHANSIDEASSGQPAGRQIRGIRWVLVLCAIYSSMFIYSLDNTITADLVPAIANQFNAVALLPWLSVGFMAGAYVGILPMGKLYAKFDAKWVYTINTVLFLGASALCGAAPDMKSMIVGRVWLGVAGSAMYCGIMTLIAVSTDAKEKPKYFSITGVVWSVGTVLGPVIGGAFAKFNWRWAFYINLIIGGVFMPIYIFVLPSFDPLPKSVTRRQRLYKFDFFGTVLLAGFSICLVMGINLGGVLYAWNSGSTIALFVVGIVGFLVFIAQQHFAWLTTLSDRLFPAALLKHKESTLLFVSTICSNTAAFVPIYYIPVYFQFSKGDSALDAAVRLLPLIIVFSFANLAQGLLMVKVGYYWHWFVTGGALSLAGNVMLYCIDANTSAGYIYGAEVILALGLGFCNQTPYGVIHGVIPPDEAGLGVPFIMIAQYTGITAALSVSGAVFVNEGLSGLRRLLPDLPVEDLNSILSGKSSEAIHAVPEELLPAVIDVIVDNLRKTFIPAFFGSAVVFLIGFALNKKKLGGVGDAPTVVG